MNIRPEMSVFLSALAGTPKTPPPIWLMRQAGRYLPEYQETRKRAGSFWTMCMTPELSVEVTLQPVRRFDFDAAILFSDILVVPFALGQEVRFEDGVGPRLAALPAAGLDDDRERWAVKLSPVYEALAKTREQLDKGKALLGFAGAPWTLATYMIDGHGTPDQRGAKLLAYRQPKALAALIDVLVEAVAQHLVLQLEAGADAVQLFDSWAGGLPGAEFAEWVVGPTKRIVEIVRSRRPGARIIGFPRATTQSGYELYARETGVDAVSVDASTSVAWAAKTLGAHVAVQGNLDPIVLIAGGAALDRAVQRILTATYGVPFIFNLGHGILPETPLEHVAQLIALVRHSGRPA